MQELGEKYMDRIDFGVPKAPILHRKGKLIGLLIATWHKQNQKE